jgi:dTDP-4-dehydrorhamnose reductase
MPPESWFIVGGDSQIGSALARTAAERGCEVVRSSRRGTQSAVPLELSADPATWPLPERADVVFLCAAATSMDECRTRPAETRLVNVERTVYLARHFAAHGSQVVFLSTNQVFDGTRPHRRAEEPPCPVSEYGRQKAETERATLEVGGTVVRLTKVLPPAPPLFAKWRDQLLRGEPIEPFADLVFAPIPMASAVETLIAVGRQRVAGIVQISGDCDISYADAARHLAERIGARGDLIRPTLAANRGMPAEVRPPHTTLDSSELEALGIQIPRVAETLRDLKFD